ncbi:hypothetical protein N7539_008669 [Penicillium diatomitis]|uniref:Myb-like domain-containing protein n=1 Tax=Penicillium diatomitis TaxID=2819901 RepID=A0A9X0BLV3_9EURO|nr:uncharacterized protein N7539_008669 [Penicillium diatomitis]KAJ5472100.1 hypothetical protein N7539_008669 [Penicillium diatomitis]
MPSASYRLESFRPWKPSQEKEQPLRDRLGICRYPSPVSISATPSPSNLRNSISESQEIYAPRPERHPLPARPPVEVCLNGGLQSNTQHESEGLAPTSPINPGPETFDIDNSLFPDDPPNSGDVDRTMTFEQIAPDSELQFLGFDSNGRQLAFPPSQQAQLGFLESPISLESPTIDPAILDNNHTRDFEQTQQTATTPIAPTISRQIPVEHSRSPARGAHCHSKQQDSVRPVKAGRRPAKISKVSVVIDNRPKNRASRSGLGLGRKNVSLPTLRAQFSAPPVEERVQFLSWLFESALSHCVHLPHGSDRSQHANRDAELVDRPRTPCSRKGLSWSDEEADLLVKLREEEHLAWSEVTERFGEKFPGRSQGSLQVYWSTRLGKRRSSPVENV